MLFRMTAGSPSKRWFRKTTRQFHARPGLLDSFHPYLEEQDEAHPLVVRVVLLGIFVVKIVGHTGMGNLPADLKAKKKD